MTAASTMDRAEQPISGPDWSQICWWDCSLAAAVLFKWQYPSLQRCPDMGELAREVSLLGLCVVIVARDLFHSAIERCVPLWCRYCGDVRRVTPWETGTDLCSTRDLVERVKKFRSFFPMHRALKEALLSFWQPQPFVSSFFFGLVWCTWVACTIAHL